MKKKKSKQIAMPGAPPTLYRDPPRVSVDIKKANNGYVVSSYDSRRGEIVMVAKDKREMKAHSDKLLHRTKI